MTLRRRSETIRKARGESRVRQLDSESIGALNRRMQTRKRVSSKNAHAHGPPAFAMDPDYYPSPYDDYAAWVSFAQWFDISPIPASKFGIKEKVKAAREKMLAHRGAQKNTARTITKWKHHPSFDGYTAVARTGPLVDLMVLVLDNGKFRATYRRARSEWRDIGDFGSLAIAKREVVAAI